MKSNVSSLLASGKQYVQTLRSEKGTRVLGVLMLMFAFSMFVIGRWSSPTPVLMQQKVAGLKLEVIQQQHLLDQLSRDQDANVNALAARLAELKAASTRLDALGQRLVQLGQLDPEEFDFSQPPPVGGPERIISDGQSSVIDVSQAISHLSRTLQHQMTRLDALQLLLMDRNLEIERTPAGWPVSSGWISSGFGERNDPFTGKRAQHEGLDFAGVKGSEILGVARGVVIWAGLKQGYGKTLEIDHGNGYVTRYAHNEELLVNAGDRVIAGQTVARMGETGRASSPHVHFEVLHNGNAVNPNQFVKQMR
jgi:murein DD-endopeptidase MepM/ murein hydrolase activator NlpD